MLSVAIASLTIAGATATQAPPIILYRGAKVPGQSMRYWDVTDTTLNTLEPDKIFGGMQTVPVGSGKAFLIRFGDLRRIIGPNKKIVKASVRLYYWSSVAPILREAGTMLTPWGEGPLQVDAPWAQPAVKPGQKPAPIQWASNWKLRRSGEYSSSWQSPGAQGPRDYKQIPQARQIETDKEQLVVNGLEEAVQAHYDDPGTNFGFVFRFDGVSDVTTSQSPDARPRLEIETADLAPSSKGDLSVVQIDMSPQPAGNTDTSGGIQSAEQDGQTVIIRTKPRGTRPWPSNGETVTLTARVKNVGEKPISGYTFNWWMHEQPGILSESSRTINPGETVAITTQVPYRAFHADHRIDPVSFHIRAKEGESSLANNELGIQLNALSLKVVVDKATVEGLMKPNFMGSASWEDYIQAHIEFINESVFPNCVFATAPSGILERIRVQSLEVAGANSADTPDSSVDGVLRLDGFTADTSQLSPELLRRILLAMGLPDLRAVTNAGSFGPGAPDVYGGLLGGDTRNTSYLPVQILLSNKPVFDPFLDALFAEDTDLLSWTHTGLMNDALGKRAGFEAHPMLPQPGVVLLQFIDKGGKRIPNATLTLYQTAGGKIDENRVLATMKTDTEGSVIVPKRTIGVQEPLVTATGQNMVANVFGRIDPAGSNGLIAIKVESNGQSDWAWVKAWQLSDAARRTPGAMILSLRMNFSTAAIDMSSNVARNRIVTDSTGQSSATLGALVDDNTSSPVALGGKMSDWLEIDLGRDRVVGELQLIGGSDPFWESFDIYVYATGQTPEQGMLWSREKAWSWSIANASTPLSGGARSVAYRGVAQRFRYIRIVNRSSMTKASLFEIRAYPIIQEGGN